MTKETKSKSMQKPSTHQILSIQKVIKLHSTELSMIATSTEKLDEAVQKNDSEARKSK